MLFPSSPSQHKVTLTAPLAGRPVPWAFPPASSVVALGGSLHLKSGSTAIPLLYPLNTLLILPLALYSVGEGVSRKDVDECILAFDSVGLKGETGLLLELEPPESTLSLRGVHFGFSFFRFVHSLHPSACF